MPVSVITKGTYMKSNPTQGLLPVCAQSGVVRIAHFLQHRVTSNYNHGVHELGA